jgi:hypothetical protein
LYIYAHNSPPTPFVLNVVIIRNDKAVACVIHDPESQEPRHKEAVVTTKAFITMQHCIRRRDTKLRIPLDVQFPLLALRNTHKETFLPQASPQKSHQAPAVPYTKSKRQK